MRARILRFEGRFKEAFEALYYLSLQKIRVFSLLGAVLCELGRYDEAIERLQSDQARETSPRAVYRLQLASASAYIFRCMHIFMETRQIEWQSLRTSRQIFQALDSSSPHPEMLFDKIDRLSILLGLAVGYHLNGEVDAALDAWAKALSMSKSFLTTGYTDMIISYSVSELELRRGAIAQADTSGNYARSLFGQAGRQHHFIGLGSLWPDLLGHWYQQHGRDPVIPLGN
ncbi:hypothetical protein DL770_010306 [Monosporascus sp. CRB-9-2]|nr:hypothetical protein DL770_010306 [Monosporascus sp. CRB-9-2]